MSPQTILVTGGAGYIGSHVCHSLARLGYTPVVLDNLSRGYRALAQWGPLAQGDIGDAALIRTLCAEHKPVAVMHFAALIEVAESVKYPEKFKENNTAKARILFETLRDCGVANAIFSSTAAVYGIPQFDAPIDESAPLAPINPYGESKLAAEKHLRGLEGMHSVTLRYFNASGASPDAAIGEAHWPESHLIPNALLVTLGKKEGKLQIFGQDYPTPDGTALRDYIHVTDLAEAHTRALEYLLKGGENTVINLGTSKGYSVKEVVESVERVTGLAVPRAYGPRRAGDPPSLVADNAKALRVLGWQPRFDLAAIVATAHAWHASPDYARLIEVAQGREE